MDGKDRPEAGMGAHGGIEARDDPFDLGAGDGKARRQGGRHGAYLARLRAPRKGLWTRCGCRPISAGVMDGSVIRIRIRCPAS
ncbi:MAG: hypothetical protein Kow0058_09670 [Roseovarius sp.]